MISSADILSRPTLHGEDFAAVVKRLLSVAEQELTEGYSSPLRTLRGVEETIEVIEGCVLIYLGSRVFRAGRGEAVKVPAGIPYRIGVDRAGPVRLRRTVLACEIPSPTPGVPFPFHLPNGLRMELHDG